MGKSRGPTLVDVARLAGVSRATVSYVVNEREDARIPEVTARRVREAVRELGYRPSHLARSLRRGRTDIVLLLLPPFLLTPRQAELAAEATAESARQDQLLLPYFLTEDDAENAANVARVCEMLRPHTAMSPQPISPAIRGVLEAGTRRPGCRARSG